MSPTAEVDDAERLVQKIQNWLDKRLVECGQLRLEYVPKDNLSHAERNEFGLACLEVNGVI